MATGHDDHHHGPAKGSALAVYNTTIKTSARCICGSALQCFCWAARSRWSFARSCSSPACSLCEPEFFNQMTTMHGLVMVFGAVMPAFVGLANWMIPLMIGAPDMALPRMNNWSFWILPFAFAMLASTLFMKRGAPNFGWTFYAPLSTTYAPSSVTFFIFAIHIMGASSIMGSINIIATIINLRAPGMTYMRMPLFVWTLADHRVSC